MPRHGTVDLDDAGLLPTCGPELVSGSVCQAGFSTEMFPSRIFRGLFSVARLLDNLYLLMIRP